MAYERKYREKVLEYIIDEISELVQCLYSRQKELQKKIGEIRTVIEN